MATAHHVMPYQKSKISGTAQYIHYLHYLHYLLALLTLLAYTVLETYMTKKDRK